MKLRPNFRHVYYNNCLKCKWSIVSPNYHDSEFFCGFKKDLAWRKRIYSGDIPKGAVEVFDSTICDNFKLGEI
jgi:hypothetical protein